MHLKMNDQALGLCFKINNNNNKRKIRNNGKMRKLTENKSILNCKLNKKI